MLWRALAVGVLVLGAIGALIGVIEAPLFDLDRFTIPKELAFHSVALIGLLLLAARRHVALGVVEIGLLAFGGWSVISGILATNHWLAFRTVSLTVSGIIVFLLARELSRAWPAARRFLVVALATGVVLAAASGLAEAYGWSSPLLAKTRAPGGLHGNRNFLAHVVVLGLPLVGWLIVSSTRRTGRLLGAAAIAILMMTIVLSRSRAAWLATLAFTTVLLVVAIISRRARFAAETRSALVTISIAAMAGIVAALVLPNRLQWSSDTPYRDSMVGVVNFREGSGRGRLIQYRNSIKLIPIDPVFGTGPGNWVVKYPLVTTPADPSYNRVDPMPTNPWPSSDWIATIVERGVIGTLVLIALFLAIGLVGIRRLRHDDRETRLSGAAALGLVAGGAALGCFDAVLLLPAPLYLVMAGVGALMPPTRPVVTVDMRASRLRLIVALVALISIAAVGRQSLQIASMVMAGTGGSRARLEESARYDPASYRLRVLLAMRSPCPRAKVHAERAAGLLPYHPVPRELLRRCG